MVVKDSLVQIVFFFSFPSAFSCWRTGCITLVHQVTIEYPMHFCFMKRFCARLRPSRILLRGRSLRKSRQNTGTRSMPFQSIVPIVDHLLKCRVFASSMFSHRALCQHNEHLATGREEQSPHSIQDRPEN